MKAVTKTNPIVGGIPDSLSWITDPKAQDSRFHNKRFPGILIYQTKIFKIPESGFPSTGRVLRPTTTTLFQYSHVTKWYHLHYTTTWEISAI